MNLRKSFGALLIALIATLTLCIPAFAAVADTGFSDVSANVYYTDAVKYCRDNGLMNGVSATVFSPEGDTTRAQLTTILWRQAGSPTTGAAGFSDVLTSAYYAQATAWASEQGIVTGYGDGRFGPDDPITRAQLATLLWRMNGSPAASVQSSFTDQSIIPAYAVNAVAWAQDKKIVNGKTGNLFDPQGHATRAQTATILYRYLTENTTQPDTPEQPDTPDTPDTPEPPAPIEKTLVVYFSATGTTKTIAGYLSSAKNADLYEITPAQPYSSADLNYNDSSSRTNLENNDSSARPAISGKLENLEQYDIVFLGYPIWFGKAPKIISTFLESYDFAGKTIVPFCTSGSSGIGASASDLQTLTPGATWLDGTRFAANTSSSAVASWANGLGL